MKSVYCAVRTGSLNKAVCASCLISISLDSVSEFHPTAVQVSIERGYRYSPTLSLTSPLDGVWSASSPGRFIPPKKDPVSSYRRLGGSQGRSRTGAENLAPPTWIRSPDRPSRSEWLYRPSHRDSPLERAVVDIDNVVKIKHSE